MTIRKMSRSFPARPTTAAPTSTLAGAIGLPTDAPIDWMLEMVTVPDTQLLRRFKLQQAEHDVRVGVAAAHERAEQPDER